MSYLSLTPLQTVGMLRLELCVIFHGNDRRHSRIILGTKGVEGGKAEKKKGDEKYSSTDSSQGSRKPESPGHLVRVRPDPAEPSRSHEAGNEGIATSCTSLLQRATYQKIA